MDTNEMCSNLMFHAKEVYEFARSMEAHSRATLDDGVTMTGKHQTRFDGCFLKLMRHKDRVDEYIENIIHSGTYDD